jgi:hypothetical protein
MTTEHTFQLQFKYGASEDWSRVGQKQASKEKIMELFPPPDWKLHRNLTRWRIIEEKQETTYHEIV